MIDLASKKDFIVFKPIIMHLMAMGLLMLITVISKPLQSYSFIKRTWTGYWLIVDLGKLIENPLWINIGDCWQEGNKVNLGAKTNIPYKIRFLPRAEIKYVSIKYNLEQNLKYRTMFISPEHLQKWVPFPIPIRIRGSLYIDLWLFLVLWLPIIQQSFLVFFKQLLWCFLFIVLYDTDYMLIFVARHLGCPIFMRCGSL